LSDTHITDNDLYNSSNSYAIDIIGSTIFGLNVDSFADPNNEFVAISKKLNRKTFTDILRIAALFLYPG